LKRNYFSDFSLIVPEPLATCVSFLTNESLASQELQRNVDADGLALHRITGGLAQATHLRNLGSLARVRLVSEITVTTY
jgi:hypothetical protein